ncbi:FecR domain-containing protein [Aquimarina sp. D1M17]|uniref:FecR family protein n=1 Tax=Aquimarina acroporae TaxID=2937283 RepID=UPI0020C16800|nr:FecR domain-containing protein [Aquimarina acroporae]MCK8523304.1 FecR domain-containing protein [Aquimarina acroporae]
MINYLTIIRRYLEGSITSEERKQLKQWIVKDQENATFFKEEIKKWYAAKEGVDINTDGAFERFVDTINSKETKVISFKPVLKILAYAAVVSGVILGIYTYTRTNTSLFETDSKIVSVDEAPSDKIKIVQADGTVSYIGIDGSADIKDTKGNLVVKKDQDRLVVQGKNSSATTEYLEISIPKGKLFQLTLSDGTKVWLNAASSLKFPREFNGTSENRLVHLKGEAFFDVTTNKQQPFIVKTGMLDVEVLGTQFNVSSYEDDATIKTTLVEGSVAVTNTDANIDKLKLTPNHQAIYRKDKKVLDHKKVDPSLFTSWMHKKIILHNESFVEVYKRIERTYDVEIISFNEKLNNTHFTGEFDIENVEEILNVFSKTIDFKYEIKDKKITINP